MALIDYNNGTATISVNGGQPPFSYLLKQGGVAATHDGANFVNPIVSSNQSVVFGDSSDLTGSYGMPSGTYTCEITDNNGCIVTTSEIVISQTEEATTTQATAATTLATAATTLATIPTTPATDATTLATAATTIATNATTIATNATTIATNATTIASPTFDCATAQLAVDDGVVGDGVVFENVGNATGLVPAQYVLGSNTYTATIIVPATDVNGNAYSNAGASIECTATAIGINATTIATNATTIATNATTIATTIAPVEYELITAYLNRDEGQSAFFELQYTNGTPGTTVGFTLSGTATPAQEFGGEIEPMDYAEPTDMFFTVGTSGFVILEIPINEDQQTEGTETIILTLDAQDSDGNPTGSLQKTVTINDTSELQDWEIVASTHDEGITFNHILKTEHVPAGTEYFWYVSVAIGFPHTPASAADFVGGVIPSGSGTIPVYNETLAMSDSIPISIVADSLTEGDEVYQIIVKEGSPSNPGAYRVIQMMTITDTSVPILSYDTLGVQAQIDEGQAALFILNSSNIVDGTTVGYTITGINANDIVGSLTGTFTINNNTAQIAKAVVNDNLTEGTETMVMTLDATDSAGTSAGLTASVDINDTSIDPTTLATTIAPLEHTFYHFHAGGGSVAPYSDLSAGGTFYLSTGLSTQSIGVLMADLIQNGDGQTSGNGVAMPSVNSFEFSGPITGNDCGQSWESELSTGSNFFWLAVPNNADFTENLITDGVLQYDCNGLSYNANNRTAFTYNAQQYWLYKLAAAPSSNAQTYGFK